MVERETMRIFFWLIPSTLIRVCWSLPPQVINVLYVNEIGNEVAESAVNSAFGYIEQKANYNIKLQVTRVSGNRTDSNGLIESLCKNYGEMLKNKRPPHLVLDTTMADMASESVKMFSRALALPTISASFGQQGDLTEWDKMQVNEKKYLIQVCPPADLIPEMIRQIVLRQNITSAAILYDNTFVMDHKHKSLLQNIATRHIISEIKPEKIEEQLLRMRKFDLANFFILGNLKTIKLVMDSAWKNNFFDKKKKYAFHAITQDLEDPLKCGIKNGTIFFARPEVDKKFKNRFDLLKNTYALDAKPEVAAGFYFDLTIQAIFSMRFHLRIVVDIAVRFLASNFSYFPETPCISETENVWWPVSNQYRALLTITNLDYGSPITLHKISNFVFIPRLYDLFVFDTFCGLCRTLLVEGSWRKSNISSNYKTCEEIDENQNVPAGVGLEVESALKKQFHETIETPSFGTLELYSNGLSKMSFEMSLNLVNFQQGVVLRMVPIAYWLSGFLTPLRVVNKESFDSFHSVLTYRIVVAEQTPFVFRDEKHPKGYNGYCIDLMDKIGELLRFEYEVILATGNEFGNLDENGRWNGLIKDIMDKKGDIGVGPISVMEERESVIDFTVPYYDLVGITILMKIPYTPTSLFKFLTVLEDEVWYCIIAAYFFTSFLLWIFDKMSPLSFRNNPEKYKNDDDNRDFTLKECLWFCMTSLTPQGGGEAPKNLSGRLAAGTWWLFGFIIISSYTANLAAFLTVSRLETPIESLDDLAKQYKIEYAPMNSSPAATYFFRMKNIENRFYEIWKDMSLNYSMNNTERAKLAVWDYPVSQKYSKMWLAMTQAGFPSSLAEAVKRVKDSPSSTEGFAYLGDGTDTKYLEMTNCDLKIVGEEFSRKPYALVVQQGSPLKDQLNTAILLLLNKRDLESLKEKWWNGNPNKVICDHQEDQSDGISIQNIGGVFIVIFVGIGIALITLAFEYWWYKYRKPSNVVTVEEVFNEVPAFRFANQDSGLSRHNTTVHRRKDGSEFGVDETSTRLY